MPENVQSYPRPPLIEPVAQRLRVELDGAVVADTDAGWRICETHHAPTYYIPQADVVAELVPVPGRSFCEWKGTASYWTIVQGSARAERAAWSYANPSNRYAAITDHLAFYAGLMGACFVGVEKVIPQPGDFYGGWTTSNLTGQIKGAPGTRHW